MLKPECEGCSHLRRNQCELDKTIPVNMEIGSIVEYTADPERMRSCPSFSKEPSEGQELR